MFGFWKYGLVMAAILGMVALFAFGFTKDPKVVPSPLVGKPAPDFALVELNSGEPLTLADLRGRPFILNFWASWCAACRVEAPLLEAAHQTYERQQGVLRVIGIAIQDTAEDARAFARLFDKHYYLALDNQRGDISLRYGLYGVPETFFVDGRGIIRYKQIGALTPEVIRREVQRLLAWEMEPDGRGPLTAPGAE